MAIKLIGAGMPRTGTLSQKTALEMLGVGPCYHWVNILADLDSVATWQSAMDGRADWNAIFAGFNSSTDWPGGFFWRELMEAFPEAKVLLSVREARSWEPSFRETIWEMGHGENLVHAMSRARALVDPRWARYTQLVERMFWSPEGSFPEGGELPEQLIAGFERHNEAVKREVPPDRLLVWQVSEGWGPLCEFLEVPEPAEPLPHVNDRETFLGRVIDGALAAVAEERSGSYRPAA